MNHCAHITYTTISNVRRSTAFTATSYLCDRDFIKDGSWYRFKSTAGNKMPESNPGLYHCGTYVPIWMNGEHPTELGVEVDRVACAGIPFTFPQGCGISYNIKVINCGSFFLYQLKEPDRCSLAYCAGSTIPKGCSSGGTYLPVCRGVVPVIPKPEAKPKDEDRESVALSCSWDYLSNAAIVEFHVRWFRDVSDTSHTIEHKFNGTSARVKYVSLYEREVHESRTTRRPIFYLDGYHWNKKAYCQVRARFHGGNWSSWISSETIFTGIVVHPQIIYLHQCERDKEMFVSLRPHLPIRRRAFSFEVGYTAGNNELGKICVRGDIANEKCATKLTDSHSIYRPLWIRITAVCPSRDPGTSDNAVDVEFTRPTFQGGNNAFWSNYEFPPIKISVASKNTKYCKSITDPNIYTFDGIRYKGGASYNPYKEGTFRLYRNKYSGTEVQTRQNVQYNCGVAVREGYFFKIYEVCSGLKAHKGIPTVVQSHLQDSVKNGFYTEHLRDESGFLAGQSFIIHLPSGISVTIKRRCWGPYDVIIKAPIPYDDEIRPRNKHSEGLCGNFNGDPDDDFDGLTLSQFAEQHRIRDGSDEDIFAYKGNQGEERRLYEECQAENLCICTAGKPHECNTDRVFHECFPPERSPINHVSGDLCRGGSVRARRAVLDSRDDDIDDQDVIPPYNPPPRNFTPPTWPTPSGLTEENVTEICNRRIRYSRGGESCSTVTGVDMDGLVNQCISDILLTDDLSWALANFGAMNEICKKNVYKNITYYKNTTDGELKLDTNVLDSLCPNDCSDRGNCSNSTCTCFEDYTSPDCSISLKDSPILTGIRKSGLCDVRRRPCRNIGIYGYPFLDSENLTCHVQEYKVIQSMWIPDSSIKLYPGFMTDLTEVKCSLPESPVNIGDYGNEGVTAAGLKIAVSNNRVNASKDSMLFITYDSVCQECNTTTGCRLKTDACIISGHCFAQNESHPEDWCQQCVPHISTTSWEKRRDNQRPTFATSSTFHAFLGKQLRVQLSAADPENRTIRFSFAQNEKFGSSLTANGLFNWTKSTNDSTLFKFAVTDECGAYSVHNALVVIKECPCKNSGECLPDYRYLDGAGNFTCSCPAEYTGSLCEDDVNECAVSRPCNNGTCNNEQPGFSCSCLAGYTGDLCQTEVDECASNPCFLGVSCTDMIATFSCGSCPKGYSGNGEICTRLDNKIDECIKNPQVCHSNGECMYNNGSYVCQCTHGYMGDGKDNCTDVNECLQTPKVCRPYANCSNLPGSFSCQCLSGYTGNDKMNCTDIDECKQSPSVCHSLANCSNIEGSFSCQCRQGYTGDGIVNCEDIDECLTSPCHEHAKCTNLLLGRYLCECSTGYIGDGEHNCTENQPPQFSTPNAIYAILNEDFHILIKAKDPESQDVTFTLLSNGSLTAVSRITKQGQLTISDLKENGTVYVQVKDEMGGQNILILHANAMRCPCEHNGACYQNKTITYPVQPSDYLCQCEEPYTGDLCEIRPRPNPCGEQPCYPGLNCSQTSEGFTCEDCPPLFEGDGKNCEVNTTKEKSSVSSKIKLTNQEWNEQLKKKTSKEYRSLVSVLVTEIRKLYQHLAGFSYVIIKSFRQGSVIVDFELIFTKEVNDPLEPLNKVAGKLGNITFEMEHLDDDKATTEDGQNKTIIIVIIVAVVVVLILVITVAVYLRRRRRSHRSGVPLKKYVGVSQAITSHPKEGILFKETEGSREEGEEIDLQVFDDHKVSVEEKIKIG